MENISPVSEKNETEAHFSPERMKYLRLLSKEYPTVAKTSAAIINMQAVLRLPKGTEHFMSDLHGEDEAFTHILNNASGVIREKVDAVLGKQVPARERAEFATLIYYPRQKIQEVRLRGADMAEWYTITLYRLVDVCRLVASKNSRKFVRDSLPEDFEYIIDELLHAHYEDHNKELYYEAILSSIIQTGRANAFIEALCGLIKKMAVYKLHIVGDIFDRGSRPDLILDKLMAHHSVDIQWGNHDVLWMGAAAGSRACMANVINNALSYDNLETLENGYGINLRPLAQFAEECYAGTDISRFLPKNFAAETEGLQDDYTVKSATRVARMHKAIAVIQFKLEAAIINRNPEFCMQDRKLIEQMDPVSGTVTVNGQQYALADRDFPTVDPAMPARLTTAEYQVMEAIVTSFLQSERLHRQIRFIYAKGSMYRVENGNLMFHGCIPLNESGSFDTVVFDGRAYSGKEWMDYCEKMARQGYFGKEGSAARQKGKDFLWYLWCGPKAPTFGRSKMTTFERLFLTEDALKEEKKNPYYRYIDSEYVARYILTAFGLDAETGRIINGHVPVRASAGEKPVKAGGKVVVIDGGFCRAYHHRTGIAGYTLIYSSWGLTLASHQPFETTEKAIRENMDIVSRTDVFEKLSNRLYFEDTDEGKAMKEEIADLTDLLEAYRQGCLKEGVHRGKGM